MAGPAQSQYGGMLLDIMGNQIPNCRNADGTGTEFPEVCPDGNHLATWTAMTSAQAPEGCAAASLSACSTSPTLYGQDAPCCTCAPKLNLETSSPNDPRDGVVAQLPKCAGSDHAMAYRAFPSSLEVHRQTMRVATWVRPVVDVLSTGTNGDGIIGHTTYRLLLDRENTAGPHTVYSIFGTHESPLVMPQAFQSDDPFKANVGGVNSVFFSADGDPTAEFDSWLTIGETEGNVHNQIGDTGFAWEQWTADTSLLSTNGAVFVEQPNFAPAFGRTAIVVGQLTVADDAEIPQPVLNAQGTSVREQNGDWVQHDLRFFLRHNTPKPPAQVDATTAASSHQPAAASGQYGRHSMLRGMHPPCQDGTWSMVNGVWTNSDGQDSFWALTCLLAREGKLECSAAFETEHSTNHIGDRGQLVRGDLVSTHCKLTCGVCRPNAEDHAPAFAEDHSAGLSSNQLEEGPPLCTSDQLQHMHSCEAGCVCFQIEDEQLREAAATQLLDLFGDCVLGEHNWESAISHMENTCATTITGTRGADAFQEDLTGPESFFDTDTPLQMGSPLDSQTETSTLPPLPTPPTAMSASTLAAEQAAMEAHSTMPRCIGLAIRPDGTCRAECTNMQLDMLNQCVGDCDHCVASSVATPSGDRHRRTQQEHYEAPYRFFEYAAALGDCLIADGTSYSGTGPSYTIAVDEMYDACEVPRRVEEDEAQVDVTVGNSRDGGDNTETVTIIETETADSTCQERTIVEIGQMQAVCCQDQWGEDSCAGGPPVDCTAACAEVVLNFWDDCGSSLSESVASPVGNVAMLCRSQAGNTHERAPPKVDKTLDSLSAATSGPSASAHRFSCTAFEVMSVTLECSPFVRNADSWQRVDSGEDICGSGCEATLVPFIEQCAGPMGDALSGLGLDEFVEDILAGCGAPELEVEVDMGGSLGEAAAGGDGLSSSSAAVGAKDVIVKQCADVSSLVLGQIVRVCDVSEELPQSCPEGCSEFVLPFYHDCAAWLQSNTWDSRTFTQMTSLARLCIRTQELHVIQEAMQTLPAAGGH